MREQLDSARERHEHSTGEGAPGPQRAQAGPRAPEEEGRDRRGSNPVAAERVVVHPHGRSGQHRRCNNAPLEATVAGRRTSRTSADLDCRAGAERAFTTVGELAPAGCTGPAREGQKRWERAGGGEWRQRGRAQRSWWLHGGGAPRGRSRRCTPLSAQVRIRSRRRPCHRWMAPARRRTRRFRLPWRRDQAHEAGEAGPSDARGRPALLVRRRPTEDARALGGGVRPGGHARVALTSRRPRTEGAEIAQGSPPPSILRGRRDPGAPASASCARHHELAIVVAALDALGLDALERPHACPARRVVVAAVR